MFSLPFSKKTIPEHTSSSFFGLTITDSIYFMLLMSSLPTKFKASGREVAIVNIKINFNIDFIYMPSHLTARKTLNAKLKLSSFFRTSTFLFMFCLIRVIGEVIIFEWY